MAATQSHTEGLTAFQGSAGRASAPVHDQPASRRAWPVDCVTLRLGLAPSTCGGDHFASLVRCSAAAAKRSPPEDHVLRCAPSNTGRLEANGRAQVSRGPRRPWPCQWRRPQLLHLTAACMGCSAELFVLATAGREDASVQDKIDAMWHVVNLPMVLAAQQVSCEWVDQGGRPRSCPAPCLLESVTGDAAQRLHYHAAHDCLCHF